jgi:long-chain acyl-CoA synthetase
MGVQVGQILRQAARLAPDAIAVVDLGQPGAARREFSFAQLERMAACVAAQLIAAGVQPGDRVALLAENHAELVAVWFGVVYAGAAVVPLHVLSAAPELAERLRHAEARLVVHDAARTELVQHAFQAADPPLPGVRALALDAIDFEAPQRQAYAVATEPDDTALVLYTSGSTGKPKGAAISHASLLLHTAVLVQHALELTPEARVLCTLPLSHSYGCRLAMLAPFYARACVVVVPRFDAQRTLDVIRDEAVTWLPAVPTMFAAWGQLTAAAPIPSLRWALCAGAPLGLEVARRAEARLGVEVRQGYGMTEATFAAINAPPDLRVLGSVGRPVWGVELRVVDEQGRDLQPGQSGELLVRGHNVMTRYLFDVEATHEIAGDGWLHTGDVGRFDDQGRLSIVDRIKDLIIRGGYNVYPSELESVLGSHPGVQDVAVIGRPDEFYGEEVVAVVVSRAAPPDVAALHAFVAERLSRTKLPREYAFVAALPVGPSGKVHKGTLREWLALGRIDCQRA